VKISGHLGQGNITIQDSIAWIRPRTKIECNVVDTFLCQVCFVWNTGGEVCDECLAAYGNEQR
jgi:hypothetical protein